MNEVKGMSQKAFMPAERTGVPVWHEDVCTLQRTGFTGIMKTPRQKAILILPGRICWVNNEFPDPLSRIHAAVAENVNVIEIDDRLKITHSNKEGTIEYPDLSPTAKMAARTIKETFVFASEKAAVVFCRTVRDERTRNYLVSENYADSFRDELNQAVRQHIAHDDMAVKGLYLACWDLVNANAAVEALFANYRSLIEEPPSAASFAQLLCTAAQDPVVYILFLCCAFRVDRTTIRYFERVCGRAITTTVEYFDELVQHVTSAVRKPEWTDRRVMLLRQFQYPVAAVGRHHSGK